MTARSQPSKSFRVANSLMEGLTKQTDTELNRLSNRQMVVLLGLVSLVDHKAPEQEVRTTVSEILEIIQVSKSVEQVVDREWETSDGKRHRRRYKSNSFSSKKGEEVNKALLQLHDQKVSIKRYNKKKSDWETRYVHILDMFGYAYGANGESLDIHNLPPGKQKVNVGSQKRPVYRVRRTDDDRFERITGVLFRFNSELMHELEGRNGTIKFTLVARQIFELLRDFMQSGPTIRLVLRILRQTDDDFFLRLWKLLDDLGWESKHPKRSCEKLEQALEALQQRRVVNWYHIDREQDLVKIQANKTWYLEDRR